MRYTKLTIKGLRGVRDLEIADFRRVNLFVGANNCGKTTILESLFLLAGPTNPRLPLKINNFRNFYTTDENSWGVFFNELDISSDIKLSGELDKPKEVRNLLIKPNMTTIDSTDGYTGSMPAVSGLILEYSFANGINKKSGKFVAEVTVKDGDAEFKIPKDHKEELRGVFVNAKTLFQDLGTRFNNIQIRKQTDRIVKILRQIEPSLIDLSLGTDGIVYCDVGLDRLVPINVMGDGMFRLLSIISAISDTQDGIVLIDEIENGFYYSSQEILWNAIFESAKEFNVQIFATTHSIECVKSFSSSYTQTGKNNDDVRLYRIERKDGDFRVVNYDHNVLEASLDSGWEVR
ncbi:MAG: hypothetical protein BA871_06610 [Desulfuromonadales bacterium C00003096]|jgi:AAA15 family ATPase/GTPase|nr:MAG: hypothetical protein BA871_06610 [Desulfuromonadales bacterium C00003096]